MAVALIVAGGSGQRMNACSCPKQFLKLHGKPIIIYTLEQFDRHPEIEDIVIICIAGWENYLQDLLKQFHITKVKNVLLGGESRQKSIYIGLEMLSHGFPPETTVLIHDGVRPLINDETISANISSVRKNGSAVTTTTATETIAISDDDGRIEPIKERDCCYLARTPQSFRLGELYGAHQKAYEEGLDDFIDSACLMGYYGYKLYAVEGPSENIKITTPSDFYIFRALEDARDNSQIFGL